MGYFLRSMDPSIPPSCNRCLLLELPPELRMIIWRYTLVPEPRALTYHKFSPHGKTFIASIRIQDVDEYYSYISPFQVKHLCKQIYLESRDIPLDLTSFTILSNRSYSCWPAMHSFGLFLSEQFVIGLWHKIRVVTIDCIHLRQEFRHELRKIAIADEDPIPENHQLVRLPSLSAVNLIPAAVVHFLKSCPKATVRVNLPEMSGENPLLTRLVTIWWILTHVRHRKVSSPSRHGLLISYTGINYTRYSRLQSWRARTVPLNMRFVPPFGTTFPKEDLESWFDGHPKAAAEFWMAEMRSFYEVGI